jgi:hypothetical protein
MKKLLFAFALFFAVGAGAQNMRLNTYALYAFDDAVDSYYSNTNYFEGTVKGGLLWGGGLEFMVHPQYGIELLYMRMDTKAPLTYYSTQPPAGVKNSEFDLDINLALLGGMRYAKLNDKVEGFGGMQLGAAFIKATRPGTAIVGEAEDNATKFAWGLRGGANIWPGGNASKVGLKLQVGLLSTVQGAGGGLYFGTGGAGAGISTYSSVLQFSMGGGLVFKFGK